MTSLDTIISRVRNNLEYVQIFNETISYTRENNPDGWVIEALYTMCYSWMWSIYYEYEEAIDSCSSGMRERKTAMTTQETNCESYRTAAETAHENYVREKAAGNRQYAKQYYEAYVEAYNNFTSTKEEHDKLTPEYTYLGNLIARLKPKMDLAEERCRREYKRHYDYLMAALEIDF